MEKNPFEVGKQIAETAADVGKFVLRRIFADDGWSDLPHGEPAPVRPPVRANIQYFNTGE